ncbi:hypothetical protein V2J09_000468 [Rumex salicifolius]
MYIPTPSGGCLSSFGLWKEKAIYLRFKERILMAGFHLFFLTIIIDGMPMNNFLLPWRCKERGNVDDTHLNKTADNGIMTKRSAWDYMSTRHVSLQQLKIVTQYVMDLTKVTAREKDDQKGARDRGSNPRLDEG